MELRDDGRLRVAGFPEGPTGIGPLCRTLSNVITICQGSSLRYKTEVDSYAGGMDILNRLRPIAFTWKYNGTRDIGLAAEEVAAIEPMLTYPNEKGEVDGVRYNQLAPIFINAIKEQQVQLKKQEEQIREQEVRLRQQQKLVSRQQKEFEALRKLVCLNAPAAAPCK
jgi:hypothetical protein